MAYNASIPQAGDIIANSQSQILANFTALASFGNGYADFPVQGAAPTLGMGDTGLYTLSNATTSANEMYIVKPTVDAPSNVPFTASSMSYNAMAACLSGWTYFPSGLLVKWGTYQITANGSTTVNVASTSGGPNFNKTFMAMVTPILTTGATPTFVANVATTTPTAVSGNFAVICSGSTAANTYVSYMVLEV